MTTITPEDIDAPDPLDEALSKYDITPERLAAELNAELQATEIKAFKGTVKKVGNDDEGGKTVEDVVIYSDPLIAWSIRQRAREDAQKLLGLYPSEKLDITDNRMVQAVLSALPADIQEGVMEAIKSKAKKEK